MTVSKRTLVLLGTMSLFFCQRKPKSDTPFMVIGN